MHAHEDSGGVVFILVMFQATAMMSMDDDDKSRGEKSWLFVNDNFGDSRAATRACQHQSCANTNRCPH